MRSEEVRFASAGLTLAATLHLPDGPSQRWPVIVQAPGWLETRCSTTSEMFHRGFAHAGFAVLQFDYRGYGSSEGEPGWIRPSEHLEDLRSAIEFGRSHPEVDPDRVALFGLGGTGGGVAIHGAVDNGDIRTVGAMTVVADARDWLHRMRREHEWVAFLHRVEDNRQRRLAGGADELVDPREELMVATPERRAFRAADPVDRAIGDSFHLSSAEELLAFRPLDVVDRMSAAFIVTAVVDDVVTPEDHAEALYDRAQPPKKLLRQRGVLHYESYARNFGPVMRELAEWFSRYQDPGSAARDGGRAEVVEIAAAPPLSSPAQRP